MTVEQMLKEVNGVWDRFTADADAATLMDGMAAMSDWCEDNCSKDDGGVDSGGWWDDDDDEDHEFDSESE